MFIFVFSGLLATLFAYISQYSKYRRLLFVAFGIVAIIMGFQDNIGRDYTAYVDAFRNIKLGLIDWALVRSERSAEIEIGWYLMNRLVGHFTNTFQVVSFIESSLICYVIYRLLKYVPSNWHWLAILFFYFNPSLMLFCMTGLRQTMAITFFTLAIIYMMEKKKKKGFFLLVFALSFHDSMIFGSMFALFLLMPSKYLVNKKLTICVGLIFLFFASYMLQDFFQRMLISASSELLNDHELMSGYIDEFQYNEYSFLNMLMRFIFFVFALYTYLFSKYKGNKFLLFYLIQVPLLIIFGTSNLIRFSFYIMLFQIPAICMIASSLNKQRIMQYGYVVFCVYFCYRTFTNSLLDEQFMGYLNYNTIFFNN